MYSFYNMKEDINKYENALDSEKKEHYCVTPSSWDLDSKQMDDIEVFSNKHQVL